MLNAKKTRFLTIQVLVCLSLTAIALGQAAPPKPLSDDDFAKLLQSRLKQVDDLSELDDAAKGKVRELYQQALAEMAAAQRWTESTAQNEKLAADAPKDLANTKAALAAPRAPSPNIVSAGATLPQIEQAITQRAADLEKLRKTLDDDESALTNGASRRAKISELVNAAKDQLTNINEQLQLPAPSDENSAMNSARRMVLVARRRSEEHQIASYEKELLAYEARSELLPLRRDLHARQVTLADQELKQWQELANRRRQQEAEQQVQQAAWETGQAHPAVRQLVKHNADLAEMRKTLAARIVDATAQLDRITQELTDLKARFEPVKKQFAVAEKTNTTSTIGLLLRKQRETLPNLRTHRRNMTIRQQTMGEGELAKLELLNDRSALANLDLQTQLVLQNLGTGPQNGTPAELAASVRDALKTETDYLDALVLDHDAYFTKLEALSNAEKQLIDETESCARYIDERVLWIASAAPLNVVDARYASEAFWWLVGPNAWVDIGSTLAADAARNPALSAIALGLFVLVFYWRRRFRARVQEIGEKAARSTCYHFPPTLETALLSTLIAAAWPGLMYYLGWRLTTAADASELCRAIGEGLTETARVFLALEMLWHICSRRGLAESHFGWSTAATKLLRQNIRWFSLPMLPLMCVAVAMAWQDNDHWDASLGRMCFVTALLCFALALHRIVRPGSVVFQAMIASRRGGWLERCRYVLYLFSTLTPAVLAVLAAAGYHYTARQLTIRLILTAYALVGGLVCRSLLLRWTLVNQRKLAIEQARQRRAAAHTEHNSSEETAAELPPSATPDRDLATINIQTRRLVEYALAVACALAVWCAWNDVLPALGNLNMTVGTVSVTVYHEENQVNGTKVLKSDDQLRTITLVDLIFAAIILATTVIAAKNIPGLLEMAVLQHLPFDAGARYAVATMCRYVIIVVGVLLCCGTMGVGWSKVQWLVAAMGLGLGFGLQEIFANFISGLIILFERPVRVGDVVTIDNVTGVISRIRMRATTIIDGDRKELIIPNKEFITGKVLNWTLTDPVNRVVVNVGIAYGSDTQRAAEILQQIAQNHPTVLDDPPPRVTLESFGDSALNFVLKCFLPNLESRGTVIHDLHMAIDREFRNAGIEIAFPQQDVHVRSIDVSLPMLQPAAAADKLPWPSTAKPTQVGKVA